MLHPITTPAKQNPADLFRYAIVIDDAGGYDVFKVQADGRPGDHLPSNSGQWSGFPRPAFAATRAIYVTSDGTYPIALYAAEAAAAEAGRPELVARCRRIDGKLTCHHCSATFRQTNKLSLHLVEQHGDGGGATVAWYADLPRES